MSIPIWVSLVSSDYFMNQALKNMSPFLSEDNRLELIGSITALFWLIGGLFNDPFLLLISLVVTLLIMIYLAIYSMISSKFHYDIHVASFRRMVTGGLAHWTYTGGRNSGPAELDLAGSIIPVEAISAGSLIGLIVFWSGSRYMDQLRDPNIEDTMVPFIVIRGLLRGAMIAGLIFALLTRHTLIPDVLSFPYLFVIYLVEPFIYGFSQLMNPTVSRTELTLGNARLPSVALRESFVSNFLILLFTMMFNGLEGDLWQLLRVVYLMGVVITFIYSMDAIKKFKEHPLGKEAIGEFFNETPTILNNLDLESQIGHVIDKETMINLSKKSGLQIEPGSIVVPLKETKGKMNALVIGKGKNILDIDDQRIGEVVDGISTVLIPTKEFKSITQNYIGTHLSSIDLEDLNLPSLVELKQYVGLLSSNMGNFVDRVINKITEIDLSNYGVTEHKDGTEVNLPGIYVNERPELTTVKVANLRVYDSDEASTVRWGNTLTVVDLPKAQFVSLPGITVLDINGVGTAVSVFGFKVSDGIPAEHLEKFRSVMLSQLDRWELGVDAEIGRYLADKSATGLLSVNWDGEFNLLLDSNRKTLGNHIGLQRASSEKMHYLPPDFDEQTKDTNDQDIEFIELTGLDPTSGTKKIRSISSDNENEIPKIEPMTKEEEKESSDPDEEFTAIYDVEVEDED